MTILLLVCLHRSVGNINHRENCMIHFTWSQFPLSKVYSGDILFSKRKRKKGNSCQLLKNLAPNLNVRIQNLFIRWNGSAKYFLPISHVFLGWKSWQSHFFHIFQYLRHIYVWLSVASFIKYSSLHEYLLYVSRDGKISKKGQKWSMAFLKNNHLDNSTSLSAKMKFGNALLRAPAAPYTATLICDRILLNRHVILHYTIPKPYIQVCFCSCFSTKLTNDFYCLQLHIPFADAILRP